MRARYKRELDRNYLILEQEDAKSNYQVDMLVRNRIPGLLECRLNLVDQKAGLYYEITSKQSLRLLLERRRLTGTELETFLNKLLEAAGSCEEYLLDTGSLLLDPDYIYLDSDHWEFFFCLFPFSQGKIRNGLLELAEYLLDRLDKQDSKAVALGYEFYRMAGEEHGSLEEVLVKWQEENKKKPEPENTAHKKETYGENKMEEPPMTDRVGETVFLKKDTVLILRSENPAYSSMEIKGTSFLIGKKKDAVDGWVKARGISRIHGKISREEDGCYLTDLNSTNGTFLNGGRLEVNEKARIRPGDVVGFADVKYVVELSDGVMAL